jgi:hypothetical protein
MGILKYMFDRKYREEYSEELTAKINKTDEKVEKAYEEGTKTSKIKKNND